MTSDQSPEQTQSTTLQRFGSIEAHASTIASRDDQISIVHFWRVLQKRQWLVLGTLAFLVTAVTVVSLFLPKRYEASSRILIDLDGPDDLGLEQVVMPLASTSIRSSRPRYASHKAIRLPAS